MKQSPVSLLAIAVALSATAAFAEEPSVASGGYATVMGGASFHEQGRARFNLVNNDLKFKTGWAGLIAGGYKWDNGMRTELEASYRRNAANYLNTEATKLTGNQDDLSFMINALYDFTTDTRFTPYIGAGLGLSTSNWQKITGPALAVYDTSSTKFAYQAIAGVAYTMTPNWQFVADYRYKVTHDHSHSDTNHVNNVTAYDNNSHTILVGFRYTWGKPETKTAAAAPPPPPAPAAKPAPPPVPQKFLVFFDFDKSNLRSDAKQIVAEAAAYAKKNGKTVITATGHADTSGSDAYNMALSERRADAVKAELSRLGIPANEISVRSKGESEPLVQTGDGVKEPQNRRVEIILD